MLEAAAAVEVGPGPAHPYANYVRDPNKFAVSWELVPGRGAFEKPQESALATAKQLALSGKVHAVTITDNPGGASALSAAMMAAEIKQLGIEPLVHLTCKDKNRNELESLLFGLARARVNNLLVMTGDYPQAGAISSPKPVFDLDPVTLMALISRMNRGLEVPTPKGTATLKPAHFFAGVAASPFKAREAEQMGQYFKLSRKLKAGAQFVVSQIGFDARKFHELLRVVELLGFAQIPVIGNIYVLPLSAARLMHANRLPGCVVTDKLLAEIEQEAKSPDRGKHASLERAAKMYAILKGMGFAGAHVSGNGLSCDIEALIERGEEISADWRELVREFDYPMKNAWYYFERDDTNGLNSAQLSKRGQRPKSTFGYQAMSALHNLMFEKSGQLFEPMQRMCKVVDGSPFETAFTRFEHVVKDITSDCLQCGDCAMLDLAYLCPQSQCAKNQRNGPCGGSRDGFCEKYPNEKECFYVRAYERATFQDCEPIPPLNYELNRTSSWINFFLGRDHSAERLGIPKIDRKHGKG